MASTNSNSYSYLACSFNYDIYHNIQSLINQNFYPEQAQMIVEQIQTDEINQIQEPMSPELFTAFKLLKISSKISILSTQLWLLQEEFQSISDTFSGIDYDEIARYETSERDSMERIIRKLAEEGDDIASQYGEEFTQHIIDHINHLNESASDSYDYYMDNRLSIYHMAVQAVQEVADENKVEIDLDDRDHIFNCRSVQDLNDYADYFNLYSNFAADKKNDYAWTNYQMGYGDNGLMKFYVISMTLLLFHSAKKSLSKSLSTDEGILTEAGLKKYAKLLYNKTSKAMREIMAKPGFEVADVPALPAEKQMKNIHKQMKKLMMDINFSNIPVTHEINTKDAKQLNDFIPSKNPQKQLGVKGEQSAA